MAAREATAIRQNGREVCHGLRTPVCPAAAAAKDAVSQAGSVIAVPTTTAAAPRASAAAAESGLW